MILFKSSMDCYTGSDLDIVISCLALRLGGCLFFSAQLDHGDYAAVLFPPDDGFGVGWRHALG